MPDSSGKLEASISPSVEICNDQALASGLFNENKAVRIVLLFHKPLTKSLSLTASLLNSNLGCS